MPSEAELLAQLKRLSAVLDERVPRVSELDRYYDGDYPLPPLVQKARVTRAYQMLQEMTAANWPKLIVDAVEERLEVQGIRYGDSSDDEAWEIWQDNGLDAESSMLHLSTLTDGRAYAIIWADERGNPQVTYEHASLCAVEYERGSHRKRRAAIRRWMEGGRWYATLYLPDFIYKFKASGEGKELPREGGSIWERRSDDYAMPNPLGEVPVVEFAVNRSLRPTPFGTAAGEFEPNLRHIDRIHYKIFSGLVALTWSGFPLRALIGDPILYDDDGEPIKPFDALISDVIQLENPQAKLQQLPEADLTNYSPEQDIKHLAAVTKTPAYYLLGELVNISADGIRAGEGGLISKCRRHHRTLGESHEDVTRLCFKVKNPDDERASDMSAEVIWRNPESRSLAEQADAFAKLTGASVPWQVAAEKVLGMTPQEISRSEAQRGADVLTSLLAQPQNGTPAE